MIAAGTWATHLQKKHALKAEALEANPHFLGSYPQKVSEQINDHDNNLLELFLLLGKVELIFL